MLNRNLNDYAVSFSYYVPNGDLWVSKQIPESNFFKLLYGLAYVILDADNNLKNFRREFIPKNTNYFLEEWEILLGIPEGCLTNTGTNEERRKNILGCLSALGCITKEDWINLAKVMGFDIEIRNGVNGNTFPMTLPFILGDLKTLRNTINIIFKNISTSNSSVFPMTLPFILGNDPTLACKCVFDRIVPSHIKINYINEF